VGINVIHMLLNANKHTNQPPLEGGQAIIISILFFLVGSLVVGTGVLLPVSRDVRATNDFVLSKKSVALAEGSADEVSYRAKSGLLYDSSESLTEADVSVTTTITDTLDGKEVLATGDASNRIRKVKLELVEGIGAAFNYGVQAGGGGIILENFSSVKGNVYANGSIVNVNNGVVYGDAISAGASGLIDGVHATGTARAHAITNGSYIEKDAYYTIISGDTVVDGIEYPCADPCATEPQEEELPISDATIEVWTAEAEAGGTISSPCPYEITSNAVLGPIKIACDLDITGTGFTVTLLGPVWVDGNISIAKPTIAIDSSYGNKALAMIASSTSADPTDGVITLTQSTTFTGNGGTKSYIMMVSQNNDAENGGSTRAIDVANSVGGDLLLYSGHGEIVLQNNVNLREVTGYRIRLKNSAQVQYAGGLGNLLFSGGPGGGFVVDSWKETE
jgi:hypothetical protein